MQELLINVEDNRKRILLLENGNLIEQYEEQPDKERIEGNIYLGIVKDVLPGMQAAFVDIGEEKNTFIHIRDVIKKVSDQTGNKNEDFTKYNIKDYLRVGMPILVQVKKDSTNKKGARISTHLSIPGRFAVIMPEEKFVTLSQKIDNKEERDRLKNIISKNLPKNFGAIVRTSAENKTENDIVEDITKTINSYKTIKELFEKEKDANNLKPQLVFKSEDIIQKMVTDLMDQDLYRIITNSDEVYKTIEKRLKNENKEIKLEKQNNLLKMYNIEKQLEELGQRKIWLKCGGFITIDKTEALTAIDVNSGKYTGKKDLEETIFTVNKEATIEIARQLRLRDIGGIIIIDYIDMKEENNEKRIIELFEKQLKKDRSKTQIVGFSKLNLLEMTRKHVFSND